jgi:hypothetical protein
MTNELSKLLRSLPVMSVVESQVGNHIYLGHGMIRTGLLAYPATIRVFLTDEGKLVASVKSEAAKIEIEQSFTTEEEREQFPKAVERMIQVSLN